MRQRNPAVIAVLFFILFVGLSTTTFASVIPPAKITMYMLGIGTGAALAAVITPRRANSA